MGELRNAAHSEVGSLRDSINFFVKTSTSDFIDRGDWGLKLFRLPSNMRKLTEKILLVIEWRV